MLSYEDFYSRIWNHYISYSDVSFQYREQNIEFIKALTFSLFRKYESKNVSESVYAESLKLFFYNLFLFKPEVFDVGEEKDFNEIN